MSQSQNDLFAQDGVRNNPSRNSFDLGCKHCFTAKVGELLPVYHTTILPGDNLSISVNHFTRTAPLNSDAFINLRESFDFFFVPLRLLWKSVDSCITMLPKQPNSASSFTDSSVVGSSFPAFSSNYLFQVNKYSIIGNLFSDNRIITKNIVDSVWSDATHKLRVNYFGFSRGVLGAKLLSYLGYGWIDEKFLSPDTPEEDWPQLTGPNYFVNNVALSVFPLAAYQKIYQDHFRNTQWEDSQPYTFNFDWFNDKTSQSDLGWEPANLPMPAAGQSDYYEKPTMFDLRYVDYTKDLFLGIQPRQQYGDTATVDVQSQLRDLLITGTVDVPGQAAPVQAGGLSLKVEEGTPLTTLQATSSSANGAPLQSIVQAKNNLPLDITKVNSIIQGEFSVLSLRLAQFVQKYKEIKQSGRQDIADQVYRQFGVRMNEDIAGLSRYIGGNSNNIEISPVINNNLIDDNSPEIKGYATANDNFSFSFDNKNGEYGVLMCLYNCRPTVDYAICAPDPQVCVTDATQLPLPAFDSIGLQSVPFYWLNNGFQTKSGTFSMGYVPRYAEFKSNYDRVSGAFRTTLRNWVAAFTPDYLDQLFDDSNEYVPNFNFFKVNPKFMDSVFNVKADSFTSTDHLLVNAYFDVRCVRNLSYDGLPY